MSPSTYRCHTFADLVGPAAHTARILQAKLARLDPAVHTVKLILCGPSGVGKSQLADLFAHTLLGDGDAAAGRKSAAYGLEKISGAAIGIEEVAHWHRHRGLGNLFAAWKVKRIEEIDKMTTAAQVLMLEHLDEVPPGTAIVGTSNVFDEELTARFQRRFQVLEVGAPSMEQVAAFLQRWVQGPGNPIGLLPFQIQSIALGCAGNLGAALMDAETALDEAHAAHLIAA